MEYPKLFDGSAYPELDEELWELISQYCGRKIMVHVRVKVVHLDIHSEINILYLFSKKSGTVKGIKILEQPVGVKRAVAVVRETANFFSRADEIEFEEVVHQFVSKSPWPI